LAMTKDDEIVAEIRRHREAHAASLDYDLKRIVGADVLHGCVI